MSRVIEPMVTIFRALTLAEQAHRGQLRRGLPDPYIVHPIRVAQRCAELGYGTDVQAAALLHDVAEDTALSLADLKDLEGLPARTFHLVAILTKWWTDDEFEEIKQAEKQVYYEQIVRDSEATALKLLDRADNLIDMARLVQSPACGERVRAWATSYALKTKVEFAPLLVRLQPIDGLLVEGFLRALNALAAVLEEPAPTEQVVTP